MADPRSFRCASQSEPEHFWTIQELPGPRVRCDCPGFGSTEFCSHLDATLNAGERGMVPEEERTVADEVMSRLVGPIAAPSDWKASWRHNLVWRGFGSRSSVRRRIGASEKPIVCFTGKLPYPRSQLMQRASTAGWEVIDRPHPKIDVLVAENTLSTSNKLQFARELGIPVLTYDEWTMLTPDGELVG
jgi:hypothetical protein